MQEIHGNRADVNDIVVRKTPALWGGIECSITRINDRFQDQLQLSEYYRRPGDLDLVANLGITALRFPVLIEKHQPVEGMEIDWSWADDQLRRMKEKGIDPIVGLVHHGSGPAFTDLLDSHFADKLAAYAAKVAQQFPWIENYTPVNEPLTTARFSGLYGLWYPHHSNDRSFCTALLNELKGVVRSMQEIRKINPAAKLIQTEDLCKVYAAKNLQYQADFENERRWVTFDILCGRLDQDHFLWQYFLDNGITPKQLEFFLDNPCPPDTVGLNYYVTSERYLDDNLSAYPVHLHGGNHIERYVDTEAIRVDHKQPSGLKMLLQEVHERYSLPMAMTEVHLHCTREEQMRWFSEVWQICCEARSSGIPLQAVTAWSIFGAFGWNKLLTSEDCDYEPGIFDLRGPQPRATQMVNLLRSCCHGKQYFHPVLSEQGWWNKENRFRVSSENCGEASDGDQQYNGRPIMIVGNSALCRTMKIACDRRSLPSIYALAKSDCESILEQYFRVDPWAVIFVPGEVDSETDALLHAQLEEIALDSSRSGRQMMIVTDAGLISLNTAQSISENDAAVTTLERMVSIHHPSPLFVRTGKLFDASDASNFARQFLEAIAIGDNVIADSEQQTFSYVPDVVNSALDLLIDRVSGPAHLVHPEKISSHDFARELCMLLGANESLVVSSTELDGQNTLVRCEKYALLPSISCSLMKFVADSGLLPDEKDKVLIKSH